MSTFFLTNAGRTMQNKVETRVDAMSSLYICSVQSNHLERRRRRNRRKSKSAKVGDTHVCTSPPLSGAFPLLPRAFRVTSACLPPSARSRVALPLALRDSARAPLSRPSHAPLSRRPPPHPARAPAAPVRTPAASASFCALAFRRVLLRRAFALPLSRPQSRRARSPCRSPCRPRAGLVTSHHLL